MEGDVITMQEIFRYQRTGLTPDNKILGHFTATGIRANYSDRFRMWGYDLPADIFEPRAGSLMPISPEPLIYGAIFVAVLLLVEGIYLTVFGRSISLSRRVNRRLEMLDKGGRPRAGARTAPQGDGPAPARAARSRSTACWPTRRRRPTSPSRPAQLVMMMAVLARGGVRRADRRHLGRPARPARGRDRRWASAASTSGSNGKAKKRLALIEEQLPDAVELMVRSLRVGHPFSSAARHRRAGGRRPARHRDGRDRRRGRLRPRRGRGAEGDGRAARHAGPALPRRRGDDPADSRAATSPRSSTVWPRSSAPASSCSAGSRRSPPRPSGRACSCRASRSWRWSGSTCCSRATTTM